MPILTMPRPLREKLGDEASDSLVLFLNNASIETKKDILQTSDDKFERRLVEVKSELEIKIERIKTELIRWMFMFWIGQMLGLIGILFAFFK